MEEVHPQVEQAATKPPEPQPTAEDAKKSEEEMAPIALAGLLVDTVPDFALFLRHPSYPERYVLYRQEGRVFTRVKLKRLQLSGVENLYIRKADKSKFYRYLVQTAKKVLDDKRVAPKKKAGIIYEYSKSVIQSALEEPGQEQLHNCKEMASRHVEHVISDKEALANLLSIASHDYYTYTHSINVCYFTVAICRSLGIEDEAALKAVGIGAILHDVGKNKISKRIIQKRGRLSPKELEEMMRHPSLGVEIVRANNPVSPLAEQIILQHHEKCDGSGYPNGLTRQQLDIPSRACCLADIFDALTTNRSYKSAIRAYLAFRIMQAEMKNELDQEMLAKFITVIGEASRILEKSIHPALLMS